ncbi:calcium-binding EF-hand family protein [Actinidia rufa]|uniref:Calcium-binding EF-hand family protein n=1 Tax=Actinidia rufa TaxID=165716 RepID=A0A7J0GXP8_9ERIC|nr:calcium-binding EF-hand family protein [Actinidia rufa]
MNKEPPDAAGARVAAAIAGAEAESGPARNPKSRRRTPTITGLVEFSEFVSLVAPELLPAKSPYTEEQLRQLFRMFDRDGNGYITAAELAHSMAKLGHALSAEELTGMIREADTDGDGRISFQEFSQAITSAAFDNSWLEVLGIFPVPFRFSFCSKAVSSTLYFESKFE